MTDGNIYLRFWPAQLIVKVPMIYNETRAEQKIMFLQDFLISLMSIVASDMGSGQTFAAIKKAMQEVIELDKKFAGVLASDWPAPTDPDDFEKKATKIRFSGLKKLLPSVIQGSQTNNYFFLDRLDSLHERKFACAERGSRIF
jgi:hypothetical protein